MNCDTKYPIVMVHGLGFRDRNVICYWGRIPRALEQQGARLFFGNQDACGSVESNAACLKTTIERILCETGSEKVNIIAHSKGGLDSRYMISSLGMADKIASLTTIATPHRGSKAMSKFLRVPKWLFKAVVWPMDVFYNLLGDEQSDVYRACRQVSEEDAAIFNAQNPDAPGVYYQSYAGAMKNALSDIFTSIPFLFVRLIDGESDGLVTPASAQWGNFRGVLRGATGRGISHCDEVDMRRMNYTRKTSETGVSDIRQVYIAIANELKQMGF